MALTHQSTPSPGASSHGASDRRRHPRLATRSISWREMPMSFSIQSSRAYKAALDRSIFRSWSSLDERRPGIEAIRASQSGDLIRDEARAGLPRRTSRSPRAGPVNAAAHGESFWYGMDLSRVLSIGAILAVAYYSIISAGGNAATAVAICADISGARLTASRPAGRRRSRRRARSG
jgi:hypothetical protein